jgi:hypothetical protein
MILPQEASDQHLNMIRMMGSDVIGPEVADFLMKGRNNAGPGPDVLASTIHEDLIEAGTYAVTKNMLRVIRSGMTDARDKKLHIALSMDQLPSPNGFLWLETPIAMPTYPDMNDVSVSAVAWVEGETAYHDKDDDHTLVQGHGIYLIPITKHVRYWDEIDKEIVPYSYWPHDLVGWTADLEWTPAETNDEYDNRNKGYKAEWLIHPAGAALRQFMLCFWALSNQKIASGKRGRKARRRWIREIGAPPATGSVRVVTLRRYSENEAEYVGDDTGQEYSHRWIVNGHWRNQACGAGRKDRKLIWIAPHEKGPKDKPLIVRHDVNILSR